MRRIKKPTPLAWKGIVDGDLQTLPRDYRGQWGKKRKVLVVEAVRRGLLTLKEAQKRYRMTLHEFRSWQKLSKKQKPHA